MKRVVWTLGVGFTGFFIGGLINLFRGSIVGLAWGASIGYGFGSIFSRTHATKRVIAQWAGTLGLVGPFFSLIIGAPYDSTFRLAAVGAIGAGIGMLLGLLAGLIQFMGLRRVSRVDPGEQAP
jgi:hypothetical protein